MALWTQALEFSPWSHSHHSSQQGADHDCGIVSKLSKAPRQGELPSGADGAMQPLEGLPGCVQVPLPSESFRRRSDGTREGKGTPSQETEGPGTQGNTQDFLNDYDMQGRRVSTRAARADGRHTANLAGLTSHTTVTHCP